MSIVILIAACFALILFETVSVKGAPDGITVILVAVWACVPVALFAIAAWLHALKYGWL